MTQKIKKLIIEIRYFLYKRKEDKIWDKILEDDEWFTINNYD